MQYTLQSGNEMVVAKHKHATVLLEQRLMVVNKQAQPARHESFTLPLAKPNSEAAIQSHSFIYLLRKSIVPPQRLMSFAMTSSGSTRGRPRMVARVITFHFRVSLSDRLFRFEPSVQGQPYVEASAAANNNQHSTSSSLTDTNPTTACKS